MRGMRRAVLSLLCDTRYYAIRYAAMLPCQSMSGTDIGYAATRHPLPLPPLRTWTLVNSAIGLRACCALSGTDIAYAAISLRPSTAYGATRGAVAFAEASRSPPALRNVMRAHDWPELYGDFDFLGVDFARRAKL
eukprot:2762026-Rhodomonas_salina.1